jgi:hypothetical protein
MQGCQRLGSAERAGVVVVKETWPTQASHYKDGPGSHGVPG